jgi:hypothetical protein
VLVLVFLSEWTALVFENMKERSFDALESLCRTRFSSTNYYLRSPKHVMRLMALLLVLGLVQLTTTKP